MGQLGPGTLDKISGALGESTDGTKSAIGAAIPAMLAQVANKANTEEGANELYEMLDDKDGSSLDNYSEMLSEGNREDLKEKGSGMLSGLMGNGAGGFTSLLSSFTGMGGNKMSSLLGMVAPLIMGSLGKAKSSMGLNASGLSNMLSEQSSQFKDALPAGLGDKLGSLGLGASMAGLGGTAATSSKEVVSNVGHQTTEVVGGTVNKTGEVVSGASGAVGTGANAVTGAATDGASAVGGAATETAAAGGGFLKKLLPILGILGLLAVGFWFWKGSDANPIDATKNVANKTVNATKNAAGNAVDATKNAAGNAVDATKNAAGNAANATKNAAGNAVDATKNAAGNVANTTKNAAGNAANAVKNAAGKTAAVLGFDKASKEAEFANSLSTGKARVGSNFILDKVTFASGSANLASSSYAQLNNIQKVMTSYPDLKVKLVGHTDNTGNADSNVKLSKARAAAVLTYLTGKGINRSRLTSDGIGGAKPIASNATSDGKRQNRRVEAVISSLK